MSERASGGTHRGSAAIQQPKCHPEQGDRYDQVDHFDVQEAP